MMLFFLQQTHENVSEFLTIFYIYNSVSQLYSNHATYFTLENPHSEPPNQKYPKKDMKKNIIIL